MVSTGGTDFKEDIYRLKQVISCKWEFLRWFTYLLEHLAEF
jgi:hypothetical protein